MSTTEDNKDYLIKKNGINFVYKPKEYFPLKGLYC